MMYLEAMMEHVWRSSMGPEFSDFEDALGDRDYGNAEMHFSGHHLMNLEIHMKAEIV
jgi:hypothetical protein